MTEAVFDYEHRVWGTTEVAARPWTLQGLKLRYCLEDLRSVAGSVADVGCGGGNMARAIKRERPDLDVAGADVSRAAVESARSAGGEVAFEVAEVTHLPWRSGSLDAAVMFDVLEHVPDPEAGLREICRVLKPGGLFHVAQPLEDQPGTMHRWLRRHGWRAKERHSGHIQTFDASGFAKLASAAGFEVTRVRYSAHHLMTAADILYYLWLDVAPRRRPATAVGRQSPPGFLKAAVATIGWYESRLLQPFPGTCGHFTCLRRD